MSNAGKCAGPPGWLSASGRLFPGAGKRRAGFLPPVPAPSFPRAGTPRLRGRYHWDGTPPPRPRTLRPRTAPPGLAPPPPRHPSCGAGSSWAVPPGLALSSRHSPSRAGPVLLPAPAGAHWLPAGHRAPRDCPCPVARPAGMGTSSKPGRGGAFRGQPHWEIGRAAPAEGRGSVPALPSDTLNPSQSPREFCCDFLSESVVWGEVMVFAEFSLQGKPKAFLLPSVNFPEFFLDVNWEGQRDRMRREQILKTRRSTVKQ